MRICFVVQSIYSQLDSYTTTYLAYEAYRRGHDLCYTTVNSFSYGDDQRVSATVVRPLEGPYSSRQELLDAIKDPKAIRNEACLSNFDVVFLRQKPSAKKPKPVFKGAALKLKKHVAGLFETSKEVNDPKKKKKARAIIEAAMDWHRIAYICLGDHWKKQSEKNRNSFKAILKEIISLSAYSRMGDFWGGTSYEFEKIDIKRKTAYVVARFDTDDESYRFEYFFRKIAKGWLIVDLSYEELKYSENISEQINAFLNEKSFAELLKKMRKRRTELKEDNSKKQKPKG